MYCKTLIFGTDYTDLHGFCVMLYEEITKVMKAVADLRPEHEWQLVNYLTACRKELGLLINFGHSVKVKRKIFTENRTYTGKQ